MINPTIQLINCQFVALRHDIDYDEFQYLTPIYLCPYTIVSNTTCTHCCDVSENIYSLYYALLKHSLCHGCKNLVNNRISAEQVHCRWPSPKLFKQLPEILAKKEGRVRLNDLMYYLKFFLK